MLRPLTLAVDGLLDDINSLVIATRGLIQPAAPIEEVKIVIPPRGGFSGGKKKKQIPIIKLKKPERLEQSPSTHKLIYKDDDEILEILLSIILSGKLE